MSQDRARGTQGPQGATGPVGSIGSTGPMGATGVRGATGPFGGIHFVSGTTTIDFGSAPGTNITTATIIGQSDITTSNQVNAFINGTATLTHNVIEHAIAPIKLTCTQIVNGTGFTITAVSDWRLTGIFNIAWHWY